MTYPEMCPTSSTMEEVKQAPSFEGSEKRLELDFFSGGPNPSVGLRAIARHDLDAMLDLAACTIVSVRNGEFFDAYVLSESSLFIYPNKLVIKTCGTTKLLNAVGRILELAQGVGMRPMRVKYSRASFLFPEFQPKPHSSWPEEVAILQRYFSGFKGGPSAFVMGDCLSGLQWHVYCADAEGVAPATRTPTYSLEVVMTQLARSAARSFYRSDDFVSAAHTTKTSGIRDLFPKAEIDDYVFEPCGYSMNGLDGRGFSTIHITPEPDCSYASCELSCYPPESVQLSDMVQRIARVFKPGKMTVTVTTDVPGAYAWAKPLSNPKGFVYNGASVQELPSGGRVVFYHFTSESVSEPLDSPNTVLPASAGEPLGAVDFEDLVRTPSDESGKGSPRSMVESPLSTPLTLRGPSFKMLAKPLAHLVDGNAALLAALERYKTVSVVSGSEAAITEHARKLIATHNLEDNCFIFDLGQVVRAYRGWVDMFPRIRPFYAVKCAPYGAYLAVLQALGAGFDCASRTEIDQAMSFGAHPDRDLIYANPCKRPDEIRHAERMGVGLATFDSVYELEKVKANYPNMGMVLRIKADDPNARCQLGNKFGAYCNNEINEVPALIKAAKRLGLDLAGVSFHVGSGSSNPNAFAHAIATARSVFDLAEKEGFKMRLLDIGGGFCAKLDDEGNYHLGSVASAINEAIDKYFPASCGVQIIAEPGRYFAEHAGTMITQVYGKRPRKDGTMHYWVTDGLYGSFNSVLYDHAEIYARPLFSPALPPLSEDHLGANYATTVFGPTCDGLDTVLRNVQMPELRIGDWLAYSRMGAYTIAGATDFNGIKVSQPSTFFIFSETIADLTL